MQSSVSALLDEVSALSPGRIRAAAAAFTAAESSIVGSITRGMARHLALEPDTPGVMDTLGAQLQLSEAMLSWEIVYDLDEQTAYAARAAVLDMGIVLTTPDMGRRAAEELARPWLAAATRA